MERTFPYQHIQEWWGEPLSNELVERISSAPERHVYEFVRFAKDSPRESLTTLQPGVICPFLKRSSSNLNRSPISYLDTALKLLLYADEALAQDPIELMGDAFETRSVLNMLLRLQPFADAGLMQFVQFPHNFDHPSRTHALTGSLTDILEELPDGMEVIEEIRRFSAKPRTYDLGSQVFAARWALGLSLILAQENPRSFNMVIESPEEALLLPHGIFRAKQIAPDLQTVKLAKLAALSLPVLNENSIWTVRKSSEEFAEWRAALGEAMRDIDIISSNDPGWQSAAKNLVSTELRPIQKRLQKTVKRSSALSAMQVGIADMGYAAMGATAGALAGGKFTTSLIGAGGAKASQVLVNYIREMKKQRAGKAVLDLIVSFYPDDN